MERLVSVLVLLCIASIALAGGVETTNWRPGETFAKSPDQAFIRQWVLQREDYADSQEYRPWDVEQIDVHYFDVNDDGVDEMMLHFEISSYFCGTAGCWTFFFQKQNGQWHEIGHGTLVLGASPAGQERVQGYRTLYSPNGTGMRWTGTKYEQACVGYPPEWSDDLDGCYCCKFGARREEETRQ